MFSIAFQRQLMYICFDIVIVLFSQVFFAQQFRRKIAWNWAFSDFFQFFRENCWFSDLITELKVKFNIFMLILNKNTFDNKVNERF